MPIFTPEDTHPCAEGLVSKRSYTLPNHLFENEEVFFNVHLPLGVAAISDIDEWQKPYGTVFAEFIILMPATIGNAFMLQ